MLADANLQRLLSKINEDEIIKLVRSAAKTFAPTGQEGKMAHLLAGALKNMGCPVELVEATPGRPNVVSRLRGTGGGYSLMLNGHLDSNNDRPFDGWTKDPLGGELSDGRIYGE